MTHPPLDQTLAGYVVLVTADRRSADIEAALTRRGASVRHAPALSIVPHLDDYALLDATRALLETPPEIVVVTTGIGFRGWLEAADAAGVAEELLGVLDQARIVARGPKARGAVQQAGLDVDWVAESETSAEVLEVLLSEGARGRRIGVQHHGAGSDGLDEQLSAAGAAVTALVVYRWGPPPDSAAVARSVRDVATGDIDVVLFTSAPAAASWLGAAAKCRVLDGLRERSASGKCVFLSVGPVTAAPLRQNGIEPVVPERGRLGAMIRALVRHVEDSGAPVLTRAGALRVQASVALLDGRVLPISPTGLAVLRVLAGARGAVVSRGELLSALPGSSTDPHAAEVAIARLRQAVGSDLIQTVVKRGYRLAVA